MIGIWPSDHRVEARIVEVEEPLAAGNLHEEGRAVDEQAPALPAMPERQPPDQADRRPVCDCSCWHCRSVRALQEPCRGRKRVTACSVERALLARRRKRGSTMLSWEKIDAIPGWFMFQSYCVWRALLDQQAGASGDLFEIGVWRGRSASVLASYRKGDEKLYLCDLRLDEPAVQRAIRVGRRQARQHRAAVGPVGRPAGQARPAGHAPDGALVPYRRRAYRHRGLSRARVRQPDRQHRGHRGDRRFLLAALSRPTPPR